MDTSIPEVLLGMGDSITAGVGAGRPERSYVGQLTRCLHDATAKPWRAWMLARPGMRTVDLMHQTRLEPLPQASIVVMTIGGNDLLWRAGTVIVRPDRLPVLLEQSRRNLAAALARVKTQTSGWVFLGSVYNPYPESHLACWAVAEFNQRVILPQASGRTVIVPLHLLFEGRQPEWIEGYRRGRLGDGQRIPWRRPVHPNPAGHRAIAGAFLEAMATSGAIQPARDPGRLHPA
ncbi:SGNH/GDSL hydrolase family protein [Kyrpidia tusciae]|uniref:Lipolytic protein G-D-S-L family n=1 Tax=Kyrpidia tusciae (strain DSM 2912 / NBRC 15312 / T2) TaxID=562970 RepID=D5WXB4_KYRT2|nr:SGNH/GDSL hydrolase family protein [Kyrpidia tusciae]ADG07895.1 lipolytic protein G-D-S-L family [Kyrpidia tusciae DSM 2912]